ncbi:hypothetical protein B0H14DRAFT_2758088 [Mycena olivaceomarginata]|nr:hypothetical protein B0H14DRAFT_2758088 [Mycena olivaceomarginata]
MGARLNASEGMLPGSTERMLSVVGVRDAIQIAIHYIGNILIEAEERMPSSSNSSYRPSTNSRRQPPTHSGPSLLGVQIPLPRAEDHHRLALSASCRGHRASADSSVFETPSARWGRPSAAPMRDAGLRESERFYARAESSHEVMDVDQDDVLPSLLILSEPSSSGGDLFLSRTDLARPVRHGLAWRWIPSPYKKLGCAGCLV